jgi:Zn-dependent protease
MERRTLTIAQIGGMPLQVHWSWPLGVLGLTSLLSMLYTREFGPLDAWLAGLGTAILLYAAILLHELAHGLAGHLSGLSVRGITLFGLGGRTEVDEARLRPIDELLVAAAGPLVSAILTIGWWVAATQAGPGPARTLAYAQAIINGGLLAINLLPSYPLDGGRILKAALWFLTDDELPAARSATLIARACGWGFLIVGAIYALASSDVAYGMVLGMVGFFLSRTAVAGFRQLTLQRALQGVSVADVMQRVFRAVEPELPLDQFVGQFVLGQVDQGFPVIHRPEEGDPQQLLGMMTMRDLRRFTFSQWTATRVGDAMTPASRVRALTPDSTADSALQTLLESGEELLPVVSDNALLGVVRRRDLLFFIRVRVGQI